MSVIDVDLAQRAGVIRPLHGINKGPLAQGGLISLVEPQRAAGIPSLRLHDCQWPYPDVVDIHAIFRDERADPGEPSSYDFALTDEYLTEAKRTGAEIVYRLGESIEHGTVKRFVHPPRDPARWAQACLGIIRHYNEGWAGGFHHGIRYWEIWNEPENRPAMWTGTEEEYLQLYRVVARALKEARPALRLGGPAVGNLGRMEGTRLLPSEFVTRFLARCQQERLPLDFFSWHCYTADPEELSKRAAAVRQLLDQHGFQGTESHLNEWNYLPGNSWSGLSRKATPGMRQSFEDQMAGATGAAFAAAALIGLQEAPVDVCNFFHGELGMFGLFTGQGGSTPVWEAWRGFGQLVRLKDRLRLPLHPRPGLSLLGAIDPAQETALLLAAFRPPEAGPSPRATPSRCRVEFRGLPAGRRYQIRPLSTLSSAVPPAAAGVVRTGGAVRFEVSFPSVVLLHLDPP